ncbi:MAG: type III-A CRISPR-associated RAMP protein Csm3 [Paenibacillus sp.]|nr:type III-A CRISPR-associated RAMP protein Csm3 [Paenibacillus sp.]
MSTDTAVRQLKAIKQIKGKLKNLTGLRIGGNEGIVKIGGIDSPIVRNPMTDEPYIPGSSLKGKMRSLLELQMGKVVSDGTPHKYDEATCYSNSNEPCAICLLFGAAAGDNSKIGPGRLVFRDCFLTDESREKFKKLKEDEGWNFSEAKMEVSINRWTSKSGGLRTIERIPPGAEFDFELIIRLFKDDNEETILNYIKEGLLWIQKDALGGSGSRGYGKVQFSDLTLDSKSFTLQ